MKGLPRLGLSLGDPTGIGPEIAARVLADAKVRASAQILVVGDARALELGMRDAGVSFAWTRVPEDFTELPADGSVPLVDLRNQDTRDLVRGEVSAEAGRSTGETLSRMIDMAGNGQLDAITFAPLNKAALNLGGWRFPDEHQMFAHLTGHEGHYGEMNVLDGLWTSRVTSHIALRRVWELLTPERINAAVQLARTTYRKALGREPRIAVAALNPHGGEGGLFGDEEAAIIVPGIELARAAGADASGPFPADTVFLHAFDGRYDSVVSMYHDQGQIATKLRGFNRGVTGTAGLSTVFTTPAHGTAFDIVGQGTADTGALEAALSLAVRLAGGMEDRE